MGAAVALWWFMCRAQGGTAAAAAAARAEMEAAENRRNTFQMEPNPLALRRTDSGNGNGTANPGNHSTDGRTVVTATTVNASFNAQSSNAGSVNAAFGAASSATYNVGVPGAADDADGHVVDDFVPDSVGNPIIYATYDAAGAGAAEARYAGYEPPGVAPGGAAAPEIVYATPLEDDGRRVVSRVPNVIYEPAANNAYDAGAHSNANHTTITAAAGNGDSGEYYDAHPVPSGGYYDADSIPQPESNNNSSV